MPAGMTGGVIVNTDDVTPVNALSGVVMEPLLAGNQHRSANRAPVGAVACTRSCRPVRCLQMRTTRPVLPAAAGLAAQMYEGPLTAAPVRLFSRFPLASNDNRSPIP